MKKLLFSFVLLFTSITFQAQSIGIVGDFSNWGSDVVMTTTDNETFTLSAFTFPVTGGIKFRQDGAWTNSWGGSTFPVGSASVGGANITVPAGTYDVTFNLITLDYTFTAVSSGFDEIGFIGLFNNWSVSVPLVTTDGILYTMLDYYFSADGMKFRKDNNWDVSWGGNTFPSGEAILNGNNIPLTAGFYNVAFNYTGLNYSFIQVPVSLIGEGAQGWNSDVIMSSTDGGINFTLNNVTLSDGQVKFRANNNWAVNWGGTTFPSGTGVANGSTNINAIAGTYDITFNRITGEYNFATLSTKDFRESKAKVYPNPTQNNWTFITGNSPIESIQIVDVTGKTVYSNQFTENEVSVDASTLTSGIYFAKVKTNSSTQTIKLIKN